MEIIEPMMNRVSRVVLVLVIISGLGYLAISSGVNLTNIADLNSQTSSSDDFNHTSQPPAETREGVNSSVKINTHLQENAALGEESVDSGMWIAKFNNTQNQTEQQRLLNQRVDGFERQMGEIRHQVQDNRSNMSSLEIAQLKGEVDALGLALNRTNSTAVSAGMNTTTLERIQTKQSDLDQRI